MIELTINRQMYQVSEKRTLLEVCREVGIPIPTLCYHPALEPYGACRLCMVEVTQDSRARRLVAACVTPCEPGMVVETESEAVHRSRRITAELLLASAYNNPQMLALGRELGVRDIRFRLPQEDACVLCALCVRACQEIVGVSAISMVQRGVAKQVSPPFATPSISACIGCGTCVLICPTGFLSLKDVGGWRSVHPAPVPAERSYCQLCSDLDLRPHKVMDVEGLFARKSGYTFESETSG